MPNKIKDNAKIHLLNLGQQVRHRQDDRNHHCQGQFGLRKDSRLQLARQGKGQGILLEVCNFRRQNNIARCGRQSANV